VAVFQHATRHVLYSGRQIQKREGKKKEPSDSRSIVSAPAGTGEGRTCITLIMVRFLEIRDVRKLVTGKRRERPATAEWKNGTSAVSARRIKEGGNREKGS